MQDFVHHPPWCRRHCDQHHLDRQAFHQVGNIFDAAQHTHTMQFRAALGAIAIDNRHRQERTLLLQIPDQHLTGRAGADNQIPIPVIADVGQIVRG